MEILGQFSPEIDIAAPPTETLTPWQALEISKSSAASAFYLLRLELWRPDWCRWLSPLSTAAIAVHNVDDYSIVGSLM
jgi:hypothetical protein